MSWVFSVTFLHTLVVVMLSVLDVGLQGASLHETRQPLMPNVLQTSNCEKRPLMAGMATESLHV